MLAPRRHAPIATIAIEYKLMLGRDLDASVGKGFMEDCTPRQPVSIRGRVSSFKYSVKYSRNAMSSLFRSVPFLLICCCPWGVRRSEALRRGLCGAFRA